MRKKMKKAVDKWVNDKEYPKWTPRLYSETRAVTYSVDSPVGPDKDFTMSCTVVEWPNGEGYDLWFFDSNNVEKRISLHFDELEAMFAGLNHFNFFDIE